MKWIGQHIVDLIARFRGDVYLEDLSTTTSTDSLVVDSDGKISKNTSIGGDITSLGTLSRLAVTSAEDLGSAAIILTNQDVDQKALEISASNITANIIDIDATTITSGNAIFIDSVNAESEIYVDKDITQTTNLATRGLIQLACDKAVNTASGQNTLMVGLQSIISDTGTNVGTSNIVNLDIHSNMTNADGTTKLYGISNTITGASDDTIGFYSNVRDGNPDIKLVSSADGGDFCTIDTTTHGATTITTTDDDATAAHFEIAADGDIILDAAGQIKLEPVAGNNILLDGTVTVDGGSVTGITTLGVDSVSLTAVQTSGESFVDNDTSVMTSAAIDDKINTKYANSIISFLGQATMLSSGNWVMPGKGGISNHTWNKDIVVNTETNGTTTAAIPKQWGHNGVRVPFACVVDGISCIIQNIGGNRQATVGLFFARAADGTTAVDWGTVDNTEPILQIHADANNEGGGYTVKPSHAEVTGSDIAMAAGDVFYPAIKLTGVTSSGNTDSVYASISVHIKTLIA